MVRRSSALERPRRDTSSPGRARRNLGRIRCHRGIDRLAHRHRARPLRPLWKCRHQHFERRPCLAIVRNPGHRVPGLRPRHPAHPGCASGPRDPAHDHQQLRGPPRGRRGRQGGRTGDGLSRAGSAAAGRVTPGGTACDGRHSNVRGPGGGDRDPGRAHRGRWFRALRDRRVRPAGLHEIVRGRGAGRRAGSSEGPRPRAPPRSRPHKWKNQAKAEVGSANPRVGRRRVQCI